MFCTVLEHYHSVYDAFEDFGHSPREGSNAFGLRVLWDLCRSRLLRADSVRNREKDVPGYNLGNVMVTSMFAQLLQCFDWELPEGQSAETLDMSEYYSFLSFRRLPCA